MERRGERARPASPPTSGSRRARLFGLATQAVAYDSNMVAQYAQAVVDGNERPAAASTARRLIRPEFLPDPGSVGGSRSRAAAAVPNLLEDEEYLDDAAGAATARPTARAEARRRGGAPRPAGTADDYVLATLLLASALFFAGLTTSFRIRLARLLLLGGPAMLIAYAGRRLVDLPVA